MSSNCNKLDQIKALIKNSKEIVNITKPDARKESETIFSVCSNLARKILTIKHDSVSHCNTFSLFVE